MKEFDVVRLKADYKDIAAGTIGAIVLEYDGAAYDVEFVDNGGNTVDIVTIPSELIEPFHTTTANRGRR